MNITTNILPCFLLSTLEAEVLSDMLLAADFIWLVKFLNEGGLEVDLDRLEKEGTGFGWEP